jgi:hypothetical protein
MVNAVVPLPHKSNTDFQRIRARLRSMTKALARELRENCAYLREGGWGNTAILMQHAADEIDRLEKRIHELERALGNRTAHTVQDLVDRVISGRDRGHHRQ